MIILSDMSENHPPSTHKKKTTAAHRGGSARVYRALDRPSSEEDSRLGTWQSHATVRAAKAAGYLGGAKSERVGGRVSSRLISAAKAKSGIVSQTELLEYALSKVALEDDFGKKLLARKGSVADDVEL